MLKAENQKQTSILKDFKEEITANNKSIKQAKKEIQKNENELKNLCLRVEKFHKNSTAKWEKVNDKCELVGTKLTKVESNLGDIAELEQEFQKACDNNKLYTAEYKNATEKLKELKTKRNELTIENKQLLEKSEEINKESEQYKEEIAAINGKLALLNVQAQMEEDKLKKDLEEIKEKLMKIEEENKVNIELELSNFEKFKSEHTNINKISKDKYDALMISLKAEYTNLDVEILKQIKINEDAQAELQKLEKQGAPLEKKVKQQAFVPYNCPDLSDSSMDGDCYSVSRYQRR